MQFRMHFTSKKNPLPIRILSHNIRYATSSPFTNEKPWEKRLPLVMSELLYNTRLYSGPVQCGVDSNHTESASFASAAFICLQEVLHHQLYDILNGLNDLAPSGTDSSLPNSPRWAHIGVARDDGNRKGEYSPIIYPVQIFNLLHFETVWLSPTPNRPSRGWDAACIRILTVGVFEYKSTGHRVIACCTHLDNEGGESRKKGVAIILETIKRTQEKWSPLTSAQGTTTGNQGQGIAVFLAGDFNSFPDQEAYLAMQASGTMCDLRNYVESENQYGEGITYTGFEPDKHREEQGRIDFIWLGPKERVHGKDALLQKEALKPDDIDPPRWEVDGYAVLPNVFEDGVFSSDHRAVVGDVRLYGA